MHDKMEKLAEAEHPEEEHGEQYEITSMDWLDDPFYDKVELTYYVGDDTMANEAGQIDDVDMSIGMEMFEIPLFPLEQGKTAVRGTGMAGGKWLAFLSAPRSAAEPKGAPAFRLKRIEGKGNIDVMTWPSASNGWTFELRVRPVSGTSGNACLIEMGE